jgi:TolB-like protein
MPEERVDRRLAAIWAGDIAGYSRLMGVDEEGTLRQIKAHRKELVDPKITEHRGRIVKTTGDGMLVEFVSVVDAVRCAVDIQRGMVDRNASIPADKRIEFRIGLNVGDIIIDGDDIFGDGVNVAARLEALADPGGILVSSVVHDQVRDKLSFGFEDMGEQTVKNIARPIGVHRVSLAESAPSAKFKSTVAAEPSTANRPSIAVLPFANMSGDPEQEYFADGISEDIITGLSKLRWFFVIARNSSFIYKGRALDVKRAARELGVRYVLEGSVRKGGNRVRITAQLIDAARNIDVKLLVLVVDDELDVEMLFRQQFRHDLRAGRFTMEFARSGEKALQRIADARDVSIILILSDINMPGMTGLELLPKAKVVRPDVPVIMITAYGDAETKRKALEGGAEALFTKPIDFGALRNEIDVRVQQAA